MSKVLYNLEWRDGEPTVERICERFGLREADFDSEFGVIEVDPESHVYTVLIEQDALAEIEPELAESFEGPYSNARIEPFGLSGDDGESDEDPKPDGG